MLQPFQANTTKTIQYGLFVIVYTLLQAYAFDWILPIPFLIILLDSFTHALLFATITALLWKVFMYGNFRVLTVFQRTLNHVALAFLSLTIWMGLGYGIFNLIFEGEILVQLQPLLPLRGFIGILIYLLVVQFSHLEIIRSDSHNDVISSVVRTDEIKVEPNNHSELLERIAVKLGTKIHVVLVSDILFIQADGDYVQIFTMQGKYLKEQTMKFFGEHLSANQFVRVHRSCIVNVEMISRIELYEKQNQLLILKNGQQIKTSPTGYKTLRQVLKLGV